MTLGAVAAAVWAKAQDRLAERAVEDGEGAVRRLVGWLKTFQSDPAEEATSSALDLVSRSPASTASVEALAVALDERAAGDDEFRLRLAEFVDDARRDPVAVSFVTEIYGNARVGKVVNIEHARDVSF